MPQLITNSSFIIFFLEKRLFIMTNIVMKLDVLAAAPCKEKHVKTERAISSFMG